MLIGLCFVAFIAGIAVGSHYKEEFLRQEQDRNARRIAAEMNEQARKAEYTSYIWRCQD